jgi:hypothetical protein
LWDGGKKLSSNHFSSVRSADQTCGRMYTLGDAGVNGGSCPIF